MRCSCSNYRIWLVLFYDPLQCKPAFLGCLGFSQGFYQKFHHHRTIQLSIRATPNGTGTGHYGLLNDVSGSNANWISFTVSFLIFLSCLVYLSIKYKLFGKLQPFDLIIVIVVLSLNQYEVLVITPFISHSAVPALFVSLFCLSLFIRSLYLRNLLLVIINLNLVYSGFGFFMGPVTMMLILIETYLDFGRVELGLEFAGSSRYLPYIVPSVLGVFFN